MPEAAQKAQFFEAVLRCVADGVFTVDTEWRISSFSRAAERITGVTAERAIGRRCSEVPRSSLCERTCPIRESLKTGRPPPRAAPRQSFSGSAWAPRMSRPSRDGHRSEIDALNGAIVRLGREHGVAAPVNEMIVRLIRLLEES